MYRVLAEKETKHILEVNVSVGELRDVTEALEAGWIARQTAGEELGEDCNCSDFIRDSMADQGFDREEIDAVTAYIAASEGW